MKFPPEWITWDMVPAALADMQMSHYEPGHERAAEHDRNGAFHWWLRTKPPASALVKLAQLSWLDPDPLMGPTFEGILQNNRIAMRRYVMRLLFPTYVPNTAFKPDSLARAA